MTRMFHSLRFLRAQLMLSTFHQRGTQLLADLALSPRPSPEQRALALSRACRAVCDMHGIAPRLSGEIPPGPAIFVCNHLGYVDPVAICSVVPCCPIAKVEVGSWPIIGGLTRRLDVIFVDRGNAMSGARALLKARRRLQAGISLLNFPEGTTTRGDLIDFQRGVFGLSALLDVPVVPLAMTFDVPELCWVDDESLIGHYSTVMIGQRHGLDVAVGPAMRIAPGESADDFAARARSWIVEARRRHAICEPVAPTPLAEAPQPIVA